MATASTSIDVKWANSKIAEILRAQEERAASLRTKRGPREEREDDAPAGRSPTWVRVSNVAKPRTQRWASPVNFASPTPLRDRPRSEVGATSFHFAVSKVKKESSPTHNGKPVAGHDISNENPGANHELYIGRDLAAEREQDGFDAYVAREAAVEIDRNILESDPSRRYNGEIGDDLAGLHIANDSQGLPSIFSNISDKPFERAEFWKAVHRQEREARIHDLIIHPEIDPAVIERATVDTNLPAAFREECRLALLDLKALSADQKKLRPRIWKGDAERCGKILTILNGYPEMAHSRSRFKPVTFRSGHGGTVQHRIVAELPHELTAAERAQLVREFCAHLEHLEEDENGNPRGVMYTAAIHAPDAHNDARNYHLHVVFHDRPAQIDILSGMWDFEVAEVFERKGEIRTRYPYRQNKLVSVNGSRQSTGDGDQASKNFIPALRRKFSEITNKALERAGIDRRYDPRTYKAMGIERTPTDHLGTKAASLEAAGVETTVGSLNAAKIWNDAQRDVDRSASQRLKKHRERSDAVRQFIVENMKTADVAPALERLRAKLVEWDRVGQDAIEDRQIIDGFDLVEAKAKSRAEKVRSTCLQTLADIEKGTAKQSDIKARKFIERRYDEAARWLQRIDDALEEDRPKIEAARITATSNEERATILNNELEELVNEIRGITNAQPQRTAQPSKTRPKTSGLGSLDFGDGLSDIGLPETDETSISSSDNATRTSPSEDLASEKRNAGSPPSPVRDSQRTASSIETNTSRAENDPSRKSADTFRQADAPDTELTNDQPASQTVEPSVHRERTRQPEGPVDQASSAQPKSSSPQSADAHPLSRNRSKEDLEQPLTGNAAASERLPDQPALFDLPEQPTPTKIGTPAERQKRWDALFDRIQKDTLFILPAKGDRGELTVPQLTSDEARLLRDPAFANRTGKRLEAMRRTQDLAISRLGKWLDEHMSDPTKMTFDERRVVPIEMPRAVETLLSKYRRHPAITEQLEKGLAHQREVDVLVKWIQTDGRDSAKMILADGKVEFTEQALDIESRLRAVRHDIRIKQALRNEYQRRLEIENEAAGPTPATSSNIAQTQRENPEALIPVAHIKHPWVKDFVTGLNLKKPPEQMHDLAKRIEAQPAASRELHALGQRVGVAWTRAINPRRDSKARDKGQERDF